MRSWEGRARRKREVKERAARPNSMFGYCRVLGCGKPARAGTADGLDMRFCRAHAEHYRRHGSPIKGSYAASQLAPYRKAAGRWLKANSHLPWVKDAVQRVQGLYDRAGEAVEAFRLRGLDPRERANAVWARLRKQEVDPTLVLAAALAVETLHADDPQAVSKPEYKRVQAAKLVHRLSGGTHRRWEHEIEEQTPWGPRTRKDVQQLHWYPRSRGRVLWHIGEDLEQATELLVEHHLDEVQKYTRERSRVEAGDATAG